MSENLQDSNLIKDYLLGDEKSLEILVARYLKPIYSFVYKNIGNQAEAEDVTQVVFIKVWKNLKKFDQKKTFKPWIFQIAKNASIDYLRKKKTIPFSSFENKKGQNVLIENTAGPNFDVIGSLSDKGAVESVMSALTDKEREVIILRHKDGMSFKEIAGVLKESINTVKSRYRRTLAALRNKHLAG